MHNYYAFNDPLHFVRIVSDLFVGTKIDDVVMEGNPWKWNGTDWIADDAYDFQYDFPPITVWESKMSAADNALCFRHIRRNESLENSKKNNDKEGSSRNYREICGNEINNDSSVDPRVHGQCDNIVSQLSKVFPNTTHSLLIIECIRSISQRLKVLFRKNDIYYKNSTIYKNNKSSFRFLIDQLSMIDKPFYSTLCSLLFALPVKENDLESQIRDVNDGIRSLRKNNSPCIDYIKIDIIEFDLSQESVSEHSIKIPEVLARKRSCD